MFATSSTLSANFFEALSYVASELNLKLGDVFEQIGSDSTSLHGNTGCLTAAQLESLFDARWIDACDISDCSHPSVRWRSPDSRSKLRRQQRQGTTLGGHHGGAHLS